MADIVALPKPDMGKHAKQTPHIELGVIVYRIQICQACDVLIFTASRLVCPPVLHVPF